LRGTSAGSWGNLLSRKELVELVRDVSRDNGWCFSTSPTVPGTVLVDRAVGGWLGSRPWSRRERGCCPVPSRGVSLAREGCTTLLELDPVNELRSYPSVLLYSFSKGAGGGGRGGEPARTPLLLVTNASFWCCLGLEEAGSELRTIRNLCTSVKTLSRGPEWIGVSPRA
jgi:hypothetical protein